jgi:hypothetical protein
MPTLKELIKRDHYNVTSKIVQRPKTPIIEKQIIALERDLEKLPEILGDSEWTLTGGIAAQMNYGSWYRNPGNVNISVHEDDLFEIAEHAHEKAGYRLLSRGWQVRITPWRKRETYELAGWDMQTLARNYPNLRLIRFEKENPILNRSLLDFIDIHLYREVHHTYDSFPQFNTHNAESLNGSKENPVIPLDLLEKNTTYQTQSGRTIQVRGLEYMHQVKRWLAVKENKKTGIHAFDFAKLEEARVYQQMPSI